MPLPPVAAVMYKTNPFCVQGLPVQGVPREVKERTVPEGVKPKAAAVIAGLGAVVMVTPRCIWITGSPPSAEPFPLRSTRSFCEVLSIVLVQVPAELQPRRVYVRLSRIACTRARCIREFKSTAEVRRRYWAIDVEIMGIVMARVIMLMATTIISSSSEKPRSRFERVACME